MSFKMISKVMETHFDSPSEKLVMLVMADYADDNDECWLTQQSKAEITGFDKRTVIRIIGELVKKGYLSKRHQKGVQQNIYKIII
ncbi:helix-turn-helix domain-containing protein [Escherichia coli]|nr:helix-turn-helix domain-containing protein [Escherichia coli]